MGVRTKRGPISVKDVWGGPFGCNGSFSTIWLPRGFMSTQAVGSDESFADLEIAEPDLVVEDREGQDVIDKGFRLASLWGHAENLWSGFTPRTKDGDKRRTYVREQLLCELTPLGIVEGLVKAQNTPTTLQAVARHFEFVHGMNILDVQLDARSV